MRDQVNLKRLVIAAMLLAMQVLLSFISIPIGDMLRVSFGYIALATTGMLLGPVTAAASGALADVLGYLVKPTGPYFIGFTITGLVGGVIYGLMLYNRRPSVKRILLTKLLIDVVCNLFLNTLWLNLLYGKAFFAVLPARVLKNLCQYPVDVLLLYPLLTRIDKLVPKLGIRSEHHAR